MDRVQLANAARRGKRVHSVPERRRNEYIAHGEGRMTDGVVTAGLLVISNTFMTMAWYGHLRFKGLSLPLAILVSWGIAFFEYVVQVPANRIGYRALSA